MAPVGEVGSQSHQGIKPNRDNYVGEKRNHLRDGLSTYFALYPIGVPCKVVMTVYASGLCY